MIQPLRKWHWRIVLILGVLLPVVFLGGIRARHVRPAKRRAPRTDARKAMTLPVEQANRMEIVGARQ